MALPIPSDCATIQRELKLAKEQKEACLRDGYDAGYYHAIGRMMDLEAALKTAEAMRAFIANS